MAPRKNGFPADAIMLKGMKKARASYVARAFVDRQEAFKDSRAS
jgi:hypothetical protein